MVLFQYGFNMGSGTGGSSDQFSFIQLVFLIGSCLEGTCPVSVGSCLKGKIIDRSR